MATTLSLASLSSSSASPFIGPKFPTDSHRSPPSRVSFRQLRVSANCATTADRTAAAPHISSAGSLYEVLGIQMGATCQEIKAAYRRLARVLHPDAATDNGQKENKANEFIKVHEAYETLSDPEKRADYDRSLFWRGRQLSSAFITSAMAASASGSGFSGFPRRRWETDQCW
ncbi:chaperone protein dnaJ 11, chloroplastic [Ricinus communis]|uniref:Chaperone protein dnaJ 11, chloroplast, putative n=1 Tax=Ricinus communis TaxID=3988 RepID=B9R8A2_RICCO|nr:chaperone protein dnaJ 11, chloroplastic [Ricinus communis]EEF52732.1 Chaperone protein dnaJ 11, chloroplast precursor, putative [Ricinus communis]|eukprot:XP_002510545.1 chaperone protein dnaJ 11, chloroplastic [Ricinus communis]